MTGDGGWCVRAHQMQRRAAQGQAGRGRGVTGAIVARHEADPLRTLGLQASQSIFAVLLDVLHGVMQGQETAHQNLRGTGMLEIPSVAAAFEDGLESRRCMTPNFLLRPYGATFMPVS